jgi:Uma2 family endonuclease
MSPVLRSEDAFVTVEEYLAAEKLSDTKHDYLAGAVYAMAGASRAHNQVSANLLHELVSQLRGKKCMALGGDMRLRIRKPGASFYYYPDVTVDCSGSKEDEVEEPTVIFEIISPSTDRADRGDKLVNYQLLPSMKAYVLVDQFRPVISLYERGDSGEWKFQIVQGLDSTLNLPAIECSLELKAIYDRVVAEV